jgi:5-methylthioadenosine/S-adenosylhomocysteine deaminase
MSEVLRGGTVVTGSDEAGQYAGYKADLLISEGKIAGLLPPGDSVASAKEFNVAGLWLVPGFVQAHTHLIQTLFRGMADDLALLDWLESRIWPLESAHDEESAYWSARLGLTEMLLGGTTAILDMASVRHTDAVFQAAKEAGIHAHIGKAMMDRENNAGLSETADISLQTSCDLRDRWHGKGRLRYAFAPRFVPSCTETLLVETVAAARSTGCLIHSHASENLDEVQLVRSLTSMDNVAYLDSIGMTGSDVVLAHCIHLTADEIRLLAQTKTAVAHCPGSNFKLGSGIAPIPALLDAGAVCVIGSDGAPCNNRMDMFAEMRLAALIQKPLHGVLALPAEALLNMATRQGAAVLGTGGGDIIVGATADLIALEPAMPHSLGGGSPAGSLIYAQTPANVRHVWVEGEQLVENGAVCGWNWADTLRGCTAALSRVRQRVGL